MYHHAGLPAPETDVDNFDQFFPLLIPAAFVAFFLWRYLRYGSWTGAVLGARVGESVGEIDLDPSFLTTTRIRVHPVETSPEREPMVAVVFSSKAKLSASMTPYKMTVSQAQELARLLEKVSQARHVVPRGS